MKQRLQQLHRSWWWIAAAAAVALGLRLGWVIWVAREPRGLVDPVRYLGYARAIRSGHGMTDQFWGYPTAYYPPGYPWFLGIVATIGRPFTSNLPLLIGLVQAALGTITVVLGALLARRLAGPRAAVAAAWGLALYPNLVFHTGAILGETLFNALFLAFLVAMVGLRRRAEPQLTQVVVAGLLLGLAVMVRPISLAVVPVAVGYWWWSTHRRRVVLRSSAVLLGMVLLCIVPWTVRNEVRMHRFVPISTNTGDNLCIGHGRAATGAFTLRPDCATKASLRTGGPAGEVAADKEKTRIALRSIGDDPGREPWLLWRRTYFIWVRDGDHDGLLAVQSYRLDRWMSPRTEARLARSADVAYWLLLAVAAVGIFRLARRRTPEDLLLLGSALMTALVPLAFFGDSRFKVPVMPVLIVVAATVAGNLNARRSPAAS